MDELRKNIKKVFWLYFMLFVLVIGYLLYFVAFQSRYVIGNPFNSRVRMAEANIQRGSILDAQHRVLAFSYQTEYGFDREYPFGDMFAHLVGYASFGKMGVEARYHFELQRLHWEATQRVQNIFAGHPLQANRLVLTVDAVLQQLVHEMLGSQRGAVVVLEPSTGKILAMVSYPAFDPNTIDTHWNTLRTDYENSPLLNRATQGLYPPGSIFKMATALAGYHMHYGFTYLCGGAIYYGYERLRCFNAVAHGMLDITEAFAVSCNTFFAYLGLQLGSQNLRATADRLLFNRHFTMPLEYVRSSFPLDEDAAPMEIFHTSIGQGRTLATPMHMAMLTAAIANGGIMMEPYVVDSIETPNGRLRQKFLPRRLEQVMTLEESEFLTDMMVHTVTSGTGLRARIENTPVAGKTGTAENHSGEPHGWFVAFAPAYNPQVAVSVLLENSGGPARAMDIARAAIVHVLE